MPASHPGTGSSENLVGVADGVRKILVLRTRRSRATKGDWERGGDEERLCRATGNEFPDGMEESTPGGIGVPAYAGPLTSRTKVTSGGQFNRIGNPRVPRPQFVYRLKSPTFRKPHGYLRANSGR